MKSLLDKLKSLLKQKDIEDCPECNGSNYFIKPIGDPRCDPTLVYQSGMMAGGSFFSNMFAKNIPEFIEYECKDCHAKWK